MRLGYVASASGRNRGTKLDFDARGAAGPRSRLVAKLSSPVTAHRFTVADFMDMGGGI